jgi:hypothetical protein
MPAPSLHTTTFGALNRRDFNTQCGAAQRPGVSLRLIRVLLDEGLTVVQSERSIPLILRRTTRIHRILILHRFLWRQKWQLNAKPLGI